MSNQTCPKQPHGHDLGSSKPVQATNTPFFSKRPTRGSIFIIKDNKNIAVFQKHKERKGEGCHLLLAFIEVILQTRSYDI
jgi:hypothetical protein